MRHFASVYYKVTPPSCDLLLLPKGLGVLGDQSQEAGQEQVAGRRRWPSDSERRPT